MTTASANIPAASPPASVPQANLPTPTPSPDHRYVAFRIALAYTLFGLIWIILSDHFIPVRFQTLKGTLFMLLTGFLLFLLVRRFVGSMQKTQSAMQRQLEGIAAQYQRLFERNPHAMLIYDPDTRQILAANDVSQIVYGYSRAELLSMKTLQLVVEEERPRAAALSPYPAEAVRPIGVWQCRRRDGRIIFIDSVTHEVQFNGHRARIAMITDVTERLQTERALSQYRTQLEQRVVERTAELSLINRQLRAEVDQRQRVEESLRAATTAAQGASLAKTTFLANTSHEIRTPLTSILGYSDLLDDDALTADERAKYLDVLQQNARHLLALIDDLLDLSRAETGNVSVNIDDQSPREIVQQAVDLLRPRAVEKSLDLQIAIAPELPEIVRTDGVRLRQILLNLLSNAIKFTARGTITLHACLHTREGHVFARFDIIDPGIGMNPDQLHRIFEPFYQIEQGSTRRYGGSGLGLAISHQLSLQMGGEISVTSNPGSGSTFTLMLPLHRVPEPLPKPPPAAPASALSGHILFAEDNANIRLLVVEYLHRAGARVTAVVNGAEAVQRIEQSLGDNGNNAEKYDLVLLDLHMPVLDGHQALHQIRQKGYTGPIVGLTADYSEKSPDQWTSEGWVAMAAKPVDRAAFIPLLARLMSK